MHRTTSTHSLSCSRQYSLVGSFILLPLICLGITSSCLQDRHKRETNKGRSSGPFWCKQKHPLGCFVCAETQNQTAALSKPTVSNNFLHGETRVSPTPFPSSSLDTSKASLLVLSTQKTPRGCFLFVLRPRLELGTPPSSGECSSQLSYLSESRSGYYPILRGVMPQPNNILSVGMPTHLSIQIGTWARPTYIDYKCAGMRDSIAHRF